MAFIKRTCSLPDCDQFPAGRGLCRKHYASASRRGDLPTTWERGRFETREEMFWRSVDKSEDCWTWKGAVSSTGYGLVGGRGYAHRVSYEIAPGSRIGGLDVDHTCHNTLCVNPKHLRISTHKQNLENLSGAKVNSKSGIRGVWYSERTGKWLVQVTHHYRRYSGGSHSTVEDAERAAVQLRNQLFTHNDADRVLA